MKLRLQRDKCTGHAQCHAIDPDAFPIDDDGYSVVTERPVEADEEPVIRDGVAACPELALLLESSNGERNSDGQQRLSIRQD